MVNHEDDFKTPAERDRELQAKITGEKRVVADGIFKVPLEGKDAGSVTKYGIVGAVIRLFRGGR